MRSPVRRLGTRGFARGAAIGVAAATVAVLGVTACERTRQPPPVDTAETPVAQPGPVEPDTAEPPPPPTSAWDSTAGPVIVVRDTGAADALVVFPQYADSTLPDTVRFDPSEVRGTTLDILGRSGVIGQARVAEMAPRVWAGDACVEWPTASIRATGGRPAPPPTWTVAFASGRVQPLPLDSIETMPSADSARLAADIAGLASQLPDSANSPFRGLPFMVRTAYRFRPAPGTIAVIADAVRKLPREADPREERTLLIAERDSVDANRRWRTAYSERTSGPEEHVETVEVLAGFAYGAPRRAALLLARAGDEATAYSLLERAAPARWRLRWTSVHTGC